jgi:hypothetical protein
MRLCTETERINATSHGWFFIAKTKLKRMPLKNHLLATILRFDSNACRRLVKSVSLE